MRALTLRPDCAAAVVELADGDAALADLFRLIGCRRAEAVTFAADLVMWLDEDLSPAGDPAVNRAATLIGARFERGRVYVGSVVYTGGADPHGTPRGLSDERAAWLREQLNTLGVEAARDVPPVCTCRIDAPGTRFEWRTLDRGCPIHGDRDPAARRPRGVPEPAVTDPAAVRTIHAGKDRAMTEPEIDPCEECGGPVELVQVDIRRVAAADRDITQTGEVLVPVYEHQCTLNPRHRLAPRI
jgi:hypothetical protein